MTAAKIYFSKHLEKTAMPSPSDITFLHKEYDILIFQLQNESQNFITL